MKAVVAAFNQEKALVGAFSVITNLRMELFQALMQALSGRRSNKMAFERDDKIVIEINHCLAYRKFAKYGNHFGEMEGYHLQ